jgi:hypothetical protein
MRSIERRIGREAKAMTREEVILKAVERRITWLQAADILGMTPRHVRRLRALVEKAGGLSVLIDRRGGTRRRRRVSAATIDELCRLFATEKHKLKLSFTLTRSVLQAAGLAEKAPARGQYRRKRERRPMRGMMLHLDASTHEWIAELPMRDLVVVLDDADGRILYARFVAQEGNHSTLEALRHVLKEHGRFCELYTDRGSHFCNTTHAEHGPDHPGALAARTRASRNSQLPRG